MSDNIVEKIREHEGKIVVMWSSLYGDALRREPGIVQDIRGIESVLNRIAIILVFLAATMLIVLMALIWVVLAL